MTGTPGPWRATKTASEAPAVETLQRGHHFVVCWMPFRSPDTIADAKLVAAAPDMRSALEHIANMPADASASYARAQAQWALDTIGIDRGAA